MDTELSKRIDEIIFKTNDKINAIVNEIDKILKNELERKTNQIC